MTKQETEQFIADQLTQLTQHDDWMKALQLARIFHQYSFTNRLLIWSQCHEATRVAGYKTWQKLGRQVNKGEHAIKILAPLTKRLPDRERPDETVMATVGFRLVSVFDVSQTSGDPVPELEPPLLTTDQHALLLPRLIDASPVPVTFVPEATLQGANGVYRTVERTIAIGDHLAPDQQLKTLFHELAHHYGVTDAQQPKAWERGWEECAAESTAYLVAGSLGLDTAAYSSQYVASWSQANPAIVQQLLDTVNRRFEPLMALVHHVMAADQAA